MIIPKHRVCDICGKPVGRNSPYITVKRKCLYEASGGSFNELVKIDICNSCWNRTAGLIKYQMEQHQFNKENDDAR